MKYNPASHVHIETTYNVLRNSILTALEHDTGRFDIVDEILRVLSIRINKRNNASTWGNNFKGITLPNKHVLRITNRIKGVSDNVF